MKTGYSVGDAMTKEPISVSSNASIKDCSYLMSKHDVGSLVIKESGKLIGLITYKDIISLIGTGINPSDEIVSKVMVKSISSISPDVDIYDALIKMGELDLRQLLVIYNNKLVGLLTLKDILKIEPMLFEIIASRIELREEDSKPIYKKGNCDVCGEYSEDLMRLRNQLVCNNCRIF